MLSSNQLHTFVKIHEHTLRAKINAYQASRLRAQLKGHITDDKLEDYEYFNPEHDGQADFVSGKFYETEPSNLVYGSRLGRVHRPTRAQPNIRH
jgi:hypothetical protein